MSDMKCPFCQQEMIEHPFVSNTGVAAYSCGNKKCLIHDKYIITPIMELLDRIKKQLEMAIDVIDTCRQYERGTAGIAPDNLAVYCDIAIKHIKELEQKDK